MRLVSISLVSVPLVALAACTNDPSVPLDLHDDGLDAIAITGTQQAIAWTPGAPSGTVDVALVDRTGAAQVVATGAPDSGALSFRVPHLDSARGPYRVRLSDAGGAAHDEEGALTAGMLVGFTWNALEEVEEYGWIDAATGTTTVLGTVGDLRWWYGKGGAAFDPAQSVVYATGTMDDAQTIDRVYTLDATTGALLQDVTLPSRRPNGLMVTDAGTILGFENSATELKIIAVDAVAGTLTQTASVPGAYAGWSIENAYDATLDRIYHIEHDGTYAGPAPALAVYTLDATTGALVGSAQILLGGATVYGIAGIRLDATGRLIGFRWNGTAEDMLAIDPTTGVATVLGTVGDLMTWQGHAAYNPSNGQMLVFGNDPSNQPTLYVMDTTTGALVYDVALLELPISSLLVH